jgi:hypothetical protein
LVVAILNLVWILSSLIRKWAYFLQSMFVMRWWKNRE